MRTASMIGWERWGENAHHDRSGYKEGETLTFFLGFDLRACIVQRRMDENRTENYHGMCCLHDETATCLARRPRWRNNTTSGRRGTTRSYL